MIGEEILNYRIIRKIGEGGMGSVYLGEHKLIGKKTAAIKILNPALVFDPAFRKRFLDEANVLSQLNHPNIVKLIDFGEDKHRLYLIMEYVEGRSLDELIKLETGPIEQERAKRIFSKVLDAFFYAHSQTPAIIHRDIKPSNILIMGDDEPKIIDFGIVKIVEEESRPGATRTGTRIGTPLFMSPEQVLGKQVDRRSDIYSLGVTLFHMLTGKSPYDALLSDFEIQSKIVQEELIDPRKVYPNISDDLVRVIRKATKKAKEERFSDCREFQKTLSNEIDDHFDRRQKKTSNTIPNETKSIKQWMKDGYFVLSFSIVIFLIVVGFIVSKNVAPGQLHSTPGINAHYMDTTGADSYYMDTIQAVQGELNDYDKEAVQSTDGQPSGNLYGWSRETRKAFLKNCVSESERRKSTVKALQYCECMLEKIESKYPDPREANSMSSEEIRQLAVDCYN